MARVGRSLWLLASILVACCGSAAGSEVRSEPQGVSSGAASLVPEPRSAQPSVLPRGLPRIVALETHRQKPIRGHDGKRFGVMPEELPLPLPLAFHHALTPILRSNLLRSGPVRAFEPRGPPSIIA
jgi:hypothetical protein